MLERLLSHCCSCFRRLELQTVATGLALCAYCREDLGELSLRGGGQWQGVSLYRYQDLLRQLVLRAKVHSDHRALALLRALVLSRPEAHRAVEPCDVIVASPSSLWGRLRGRLDLAHALALALARHHERPLVPAPYDLHWRLRKRARQSKGERRRAAAATAGGKAPPHILGLMRRRWIRRWGPLCQGRRLLVVDDVLTTGLTLGEIRRALAAAAPAAEIRHLTLAKA